MDWKNIDWNNFDISNNDIQELKLLSAQSIGAIIFLIGSILQIIVTNISIKNITNKNSMDARPNPDHLAVEFQRLFVISRVLFVLIEVCRIKNLSAQSAEGDFNYSLTPNIQLALGNLLALVGDYIVLLGFIGVSKRNTVVPII